MLRTTSLLWSGCPGQSKTLVISWCLPRVARSCHSSSASVHHRDESARSVQAGNEDSAYKGVARREAGVSYPAEDTFYLNRWHSLAETYLSSRNYVKDLNNCVNCIRRLRIPSSRDAEAWVRLCRLCVRLLRTTVPHLSYMDLRALSGFGAVLNILSPASWDPVVLHVLNITGRHANQGHYLAVVEEFLEQIFWRTILESSSREWSPGDLGLLVNLLTRLINFSLRLQHAVRANQGELKRCIEACDSLEALLDFVRLLAPNWLGKADAPDFELLTCALDRLAVVMCRADLTHWAAEEDAKFSAACRSVTLNRLKHPAFLEATVEVLKKRVEGLKGGERSLLLSLVANVVYLLAFMGVPATKELINSLARHVALPQNSVDFSRLDSNCIAASRSLKSSPTHSHGLDLLQLVWATLMPDLGAPRLPILKVIHRRQLQHLCGSGERLDARLIPLILQSLDLSDDRLDVPLHLCHTEHWQVPPEMSQWLRIVRDLDFVPQTDDDGCDSKLVPGTDDNGEPYLPRPQVWTCGVRPAGLIAAYCAIERKNTARMLRPALAFDQMLDTITERLPSDGGMSCGFAFQFLDRPREKDIWGNFAPVMLILVPDEQVLRCSDQPGRVEVSGAVMAQIGLLRSWGNIVAVLTVAEVLRLEKFGQRPRDTCLLAMRDAARHALSATQAPASLVQDEQTHAGDMTEGKSPGTAAYQLPPLA